VARQLRRSPSSSRTWPHGSTSTPLPACWHPLSTEAIHLGRRVGRSLQPLPAEAVDHRIQVMKGLVGALGPASGWHSSAANWFTSMFLAAVEGAGSQPSDRTRRVR